jgi:hypothetical protein
LIALTGVGPAFAAGGGRGTFSLGTFSLVATISAIDPVSGAVTVTVIKGNTLVKSYIGQNLVMTTTASTRYLYKSSPTAAPVAISFADLKAGDAVSVGGILVNNIWTATRIMSGASLTCIQ